MGAPHAPVVRSRRRTNPDAPPISAKENDMTAKLSRWIAVLVLGAVILGPATTVVAADPGSDATHHERGQRFQQWVDLTDDQMTAIREIHQRETPTAKQHFPAIRQAQTK